MTAPPGRRPRGRRANVGTAVAVAAAAFVVGSFFLPWATSGRADRSGFALARTVDKLGLADSVLLRTLLVTFWFCPFLLGVAWMATVFGHPRVTGVVVAVIGAVAVIAAWLVMDSGAVETAAGTRVGIVTGGLALVGGIWLAVTSRGNS